MLSTDSKATMLFTNAAACAHPNEDVKIGDIPDFDLYEHRRLLLYPCGEPTVPLPEAFSVRTSSAAVWSHQDTAIRDLTVTVAREDVEDVETALSRLRAVKLSVDDINKATFVLPRLGPKLAAAATEVTAGRGIVILRGLEPQNYSLEDNIFIYAGIASYFGEQRGVQGRGRNFLSSSHVPDHLRPSPFANQYQAFHSDFCDVIGMYIMQAASKGGRNYWASCGQIYNELAETRPHLISKLAAHAWPFQSSLHGEDVRTRPILFKLKHSDQPYFCFSRTNLTGTPIVPRLPGPLQLTNEQADALDAVHFAAEKHAIVAQLQPGDMYFLNNHLVLHGRESFEDAVPATGSSCSSLDERVSSDGGSHGLRKNSRSSSSSSDLLPPPPSVHERHIMRLWLRNTGARADDDIPTSLQPRWNEVFGEESFRNGRWAFNKVHDKDLIIASRNDEISSFS